ARFEPGGLPPYNSATIYYPVEPRPVVLVKGLNEDDSVWNQWNTFLIRAGYPHGGDVATFLDTKAGNIDSNVSILHADIASAMYYRGADKVDMVAHSLGGLIARAYLQRYAPTPVTRFIMLGPLNQGSDATK